MEARTDEWLKFWNENQKSLFQAWAEGKPSPFAMHGEPPPGTEVMGDLMERSMEDWAALAKDAWSKGGRFDPAAMQKLFDPAEGKRAGSHFARGLEKPTEGDEIQKVGTQLRRELRAMNKQGTSHEARPASAARAKRGRK